jgi:hypothetical protein
MRAEAGHARRRGGSGGALHLTEEAHAVRVPREGVGRDRLDELDVGAGFEMGATEGEGCGGARVRK